MRLPVTLPDGSAAGLALRRLSLRSRLPLLLALAMSSPACLRACDGPAVDLTFDDRPSTSSSSSPDPLAPPSQAELPTTDGAIAVGNLNAQIDALDGLRTRDPRSLSHRRELVPLLSLRARFLGRIADAERAAALADDLVRDAPARPWAHVLRAGTRGALHLFAAGLADLAEAEKLGARAADLAEERATLLEGQGDLDAALELRRAARAAAPDLGRTGLEAALLGRLGRDEEAGALFLEARRGYRSVSVFPVAWLLLQEGIFRERAGDVAHARACYEAAHGRLPAYAHAASHLAILVPPARGVELLEPIVAASDDPELELVLAGRLRAAGWPARADARAARAGARYAELAERHPEAYAGHYASYLLDEGRDPGKAFTMARTDLAARRTAEAYELAVLAGIAAGKRAEACALGQEGSKLSHAGARLRTLAERACAEPRP